jgi:hypothetical protein
MEGFPTTNYVEKTWGLPPLLQQLLLALNLPARQSTDQTGECHALHRIPPATPGINQHSPWADWSPLKKKPEQLTVNCNLVQQQRGQESWKDTWEGERGKELISALMISKQMLESQEGWEQADHKQLPKARQVVDHRDHLLSQWAALKVKLPWKIEKRTVNHHNTLTAEGADGTLTLPQRKGVGQRNKPQPGNPSK